MMGVVSTIAHDRFPKQGAWLNREVNVCFNYDTTHTLAGIVIRDDAEEPGEMLIRLENGRVVRAVECQYSVSRERKGGR